MEELRRTGKEWNQAIVLLLHQAEKQRLYRLAMTTHICLGFMECVATRPNTINQSLSLNQLMDMTLEQFQALNPDFDRAKKEIAARLLPVATDISQRLHLV